ncbi:unnamed protein product [Rhizophagus irregularis]|nr:unnamed protein product [Rhizophagus irregularis]CAB5379111.1 unnamed protein product [Rhizophagus irregularis]
MTQLSSSARFHLIKKKRSASDCIHVEMWNNLKEVLTSYFAIKKFRGHYLAENINFRIPMLETNEIGLELMLE